MLSNCRRSTVLTRLYCFCTTVMFEVEMENLFWHLAVNICRIILLVSHSTVRMKFGCFYCISDFRNVQFICSMREQWFLHFASSSVNKWWSGDEKKNFVYPERLNREQLYFFNIQSFSFFTVHKQVSKIVKFPRIFTLIEWQL